MAKKIDVTQLVRDFKGGELIQRGSVTGNSYKAKVNLRRKDIGYDNFMAFRIRGLNSCCGIYSCCLYPR